MSKFLSLFLFLFLVLLLNACASTPGRMELHKSTKEIVWPAQPLQPRYKLEGYLSGESNFVREEAVGQVVLDVLAWIVGLALGGDDEFMLKRPQTGVFDKKSQRIHVTDSEQNAVFVFDQKLGRIDSWKDAGGSGGFHTPIGIDVTSEGNVVVADAGLGRVVVLDAGGEFVSSFGGDHLARPTGLVIDPDSGQVYVADSQKHQVVVFDKSGQFLFNIGGPGEAEGRFLAPTHLAFHDDKLYVSDTLNARIQILTKKGKFLTVFGKRGIYLGDMPRPKGVAVDSTGRVYVVESYYDYLLVYDGQGQPLLPMGGRGRAPGQYYQPAGVWTDTLGRVFVADMFNSRVAVLSYIGDQTEAQNSVSAIKK